MIGLRHRPRRGDAHWEHIELRERRLYLAQLAVFVVAAVAAGVATALVGRAITGAGDRRELEEGRFTALVSLREQARQGEVDFWQGRAGGHTSVSPLTRAAVLGLPLLVRGLAAGDPDTSPGERAAVRAVLDAIDVFALYAREDPPPLGSPRDRENLRAVAPARAQMRRALDEWARLQEADVEDAAGEGRRLVRRAVTLLTGLLGGIAAAVIVAWLLLERERREIFAVIAEEGEERGALIASLQNGLLGVGPDGAIEDVNDRFLEMTGFAREDLIGTLPPRPFWPVDDGDLPALEQRMQAGESGESDTTLRTAKGGLVPVIVTHAAFGGDGSRGGYVASVHDASDLRGIEEDLRRAAAQQEALARVATAVTAFEGDSPEPIFRLVAEEAAKLLGVPATRVTRFQGDDGIIVGWWTDPTLGRDTGPMFSRLPLDAETAVGRVHRTGRVQRVDDLSSIDSDAARIIAQSYRGAVAAPVHVAGRLWGALIALTVGDRVLERTAEEDLSHFAELVGIAVSNAEAHSRLAAQATRDPLTGLANHRAFHDRLRYEVGSALRHGRELSLAIVDIDRFRDVNERLGHQIGDDVLAEVGRRLAAQVGAGGMAARIGGEKFAVILPEAGGLEVWRAVDALRAAITAPLFDHAGALTVSAGVCDLEMASTPEEILRLADGALYWAKAHGRNAAFLYSPEIVRELSAGERAERLERAQVLAGLQGLARAVDAKDPSTRRHSERVAELAVAVARELGWPEERCRELREAGLLHDVGKIGVPDAVLFKPGRLTAEEYEAVKKHAPLGAEIVTDILSVEQVSWVRHHHERVDGHGYLDGIAGDAIPDGARILAVADSWDVMTSIRAYSDARAREEALAELERCSGGQFDPPVAEAMRRVTTSGLLDRLDLPTGATEGAAEAAPG